MRLFGSLFRFTYRLPKRIIWYTGAYTIGYTLYDMTYPYFMHNSRDMLDFKKRYGNNTVAVISGATDPLG